MDILFFIKSSEPVFENKDGVEVITSFDIVYTGQRSDNFEQYSVTSNVKLVNPICKPYTVTYPMLNEFISDKVAEFKRTITEVLLND